MGPWGCWGEELEEARQGGCLLHRQSAYCYYLFTQGPVRPLDPPTVLWACLGKHELIKLGGPIYKEERSLYQLLKETNYMNGKY